MLEVLDVFGKLLWAMLSSAFSLYKQLIGIQNDFLAAALGISPVVVSILFFVIGKAKTALKTL